MIKIDMWYGDEKEQCTRLDIYFNDLGCFYTGNIYIFGEIVGDYYADSIQEITEAFPHLAESINNALNQKGLETMKKVIDVIILALLIAAISSAATRVYMIRTAAPSIPCSIAWDDEVHDYR